MTKYVELARVQETIMRMTNDVRGADIAREVGKLPTADVQEVKHGRWIQWRCYNTCSCCNNYVNQYDDELDMQNFSFCPNCGAKMDLESETIR